MKKVLIIAGEPSADLHGANLVKAIRAEMVKDKSPDPGSAWVSRPFTKGGINESEDVEFVGIGGRLMKQAGVNIIFDADKIAVVGISEVVRHLGDIRRAFNSTVTAALNDHMDLGILIDFPDFNLRLAKRLNKHRIPLVYYISPQIWAWRKGRIKKIAKYFKKVLVIFKFEESFYKNAGINVAFVGHPLVKEVQMSDSKENLFSKYGIPAADRVITMLPGSRTAEVKRHMPILLEAAQLLHVLHKDLTFVVPVLNSQAQICSRIMSGYDVPVKLIVDDTYNAIGMSDFAVVVSGTATLETALLNIPMIIIYKVSLLSHIVAWMLISIKRIGIVNIAAGEDIVPELVQDDLKPERLADMIDVYLKDKEACNRMRQGYLKFRSILGDADASQKAGQEIINLLKAPNE